MFWSRNVVVLDLRVAVLDVMRVVLDLLFVSRAEEQFEVQSLLAFCPDCIDFGVKWVKWGYVMILRRKESRIVNVSINNFVLVTQAQRRRYRMDSDREGRELIDQSFR